MRPLGHAECLTLPGFRMRRGEKPNDSAILMAEWLWTIKGPDARALQLRPIGAAEPQATRRVPGGPSSGAWTMRS